MDVFETTPEFREQVPEAHYCVPGVTLVGDWGQRELWENASFWGPFFWCATPAPRRPWPIGIGWAREIGKPFRFGWGIRILGEHHTHTFGVCWKDKKAQDVVADLAIPNLDNDEDEMPYMPPVDDAIRQPRKHPLQGLVFNYRVRHKAGENIFQYLYYTWQGKRYVEKQKEVKAAEDAKFDDWVLHLDEHSYTVPDAKS